MSRPTVSATAPLAPALSATVVATLEDAQVPDAVKGTSTEDAVQSARSHKKKFPRGLKRLRDRLQVLDDRLRLDVNALKQQISDLQLNITLLSTKIEIQQPHSRKQKAVETVAEYFGAFQFGWILPLDSVDHDALSRLNRSLAPDHMHTTPGQQLIDQQEESKATVGQRQQQRAFERERQRLLMDRQLHFMNTALSESMRVAGDQQGGVGMFVRQWKNFSRRHDVTRLELSSMSCRGSVLEPIVIALGTWSGYVTRAQVEELFPVAMADPELMQRLVGTLVRYPSREIFYCDADGRVIYYDVELDLVVGLRQATGSLRDVERLLGASAAGSLGTAADANSPEYLSGT